MPTEDEIIRCPEEDRKLHTAIKNAMTNWDMYEKKIEQLEAKLKQQAEQNEALMNRPASIECPKCHTIIKAV